MKKCNYVVSFVDGEKVFTSARTGRRLTGAAKIACERAEAERKAREQAYVNECVTNALILTWYEENADMIAEEQRITEGECRRANVVISEEEKEKAEYEAFCDALDAIIHEKKEEKEERIAITGWALTETMIRTLEDAFEDENVKAGLMSAFKEWSARFAKNALACMGWKYNAKRGVHKGAVIEFLRRRDDEKFPIFTGKRYNLVSTFSAMQAITRCMIYAKERSKNAVVIKKEIRAPLARLCRKMIEAM